MKIQVSILICACALISFAEDSQSPTNEENKPSVLQRVGGFVIDYKAAQGKYAFINCQNTVDLKLVSGLAKMMQNDYCWIFQYTNANTVSSIKEAIDRKHSVGALAAVVFAADEQLPSLTSLPEENLSIINVTSLKEGNPKQILLDNRIVRETLRGFAFSLGAGYSSYEIGAMAPISKVAELDLFSGNFIPPDTVNAAMVNGGKIGFKPYRRTTYKRACKEGWAPAPTNDFQKAVWEKIHELPSEPIKILPETKKVSD